jgi:hypothetical protein
MMTPATELYLHKSAEKIAALLERCPPDQRTELLKKSLTLAKMEQCQVITMAGG